MLLVLRSFLFAALFAALPPAPALAQNAGASAADNNAGDYSLRPPPLSVPSGEPGAIRRSIMQFYHWTLICDTIIADKKQICNVSQAVWDDAHNMMVFSWSLAASDKGEPFMLLRLPPDADTKTPVHIAIAGTNRAANIDFVGCNDAVCMAQTPVGPFLTQAIGNRSAVTISYRTASQGMLSFDTSFLGLKEAVASIK